ncbi:MAG: ribonuclease HII [Erysipelotrichia bacterium]|nr:ribonuclease HII [Erysipelotrichia bacterium]
MKTVNDFEKHYWSLDKLVIGIDEAGRGPLAGPLVVAGVVFPKDYISEEIYDSKQLTEKKREQLYEVIVKDALYYDVVIVEVETIEKLNILEATRWGMSEIAKKANVDIVLTDALKLDIDKEVVDIVKGDQKSISIAAASIVAKVTRDRIMYQMDEKYPQYNFKNNKGYPTKQHFKALDKYGITEIHRKNYKPVIEAMQSKLF